MVEIPEVTQIEAFLNIFRPSKKLAPDIHEFDRFRLDAPERTLRFLTDAVERVVSRERMETQRKKQSEQIARGGGASLPRRSQARPCR